jgi:long-chain acyl-CoA synthetase
MNIALWLVRAGQSHGNWPAIGHGGRVLRDYAGFAERVARLSGSLREKFRLKPGDRVVVAAKNCPEYLETLYAIWHAGLAAVPANAKLHSAELGFILDHSGARVCFVTPGIDSAIAPYAPKTLERMIAMGSGEYESLFDAGPGALIARQPDDLAWLFYTSGTTGRPKGAMLTHRVLCAMSHAYVAEVDQVMPGDPILHAAPMSHGSGLYIVPHVMRCGVNVVPESGGFEPEEIFASLTRWPRLSLFAAPTMIKRLVESAHDGPVRNFRTVVWGGAPMYVEDTLRALDRFGPCLAQIYGQGESPMTIATLSKQDVADRAHPRWREKLGSAGRPFSCLDVIVAGDGDRVLPAGEVGEILCCGDVVMPGYWQNPDANASTMRGGWLHTGDVGAFDAEGYLTLKDRSKDLIISGGSNIYPREVEEVLLRHGRVREVSVIGRPDREWGEVVVAYVVGDVDARELDALCLRSIARFKRPRDYVFIDALPRNNYGKVLKTELRERDARQSSSGPRSGSP